MKERFAMKCSKCGNEMLDESRVCPVCGEPVATDGAEPMPVEPAAPEETQAVLDPDMVPAEAVEVPVEEPAQENPEAEAKPESDFERAASEEVPANEYAGAKAEERAEFRSAVVGYQGKMNKLVRPVRTGGFFFTELLLLIPIINLILLFVWAFRKRTNLNRKAFARSILIWILIALLLLLAGLIVMIVLQMPMDYHYWIDRLKELVNSIPS